MSKGFTRRQWALPEALASHESLLSLLENGEPPPEGRADLLATIQEQIIPKLVLAHNAEPAGTELCADARLPPTEAEVSAFAETCVTKDIPVALAFIEEITAGGISLETIFLSLVAPAARLLGAQWDADLRPFTEVTVGLMLLQQLVHILGPSLAPGSAVRGFVVLVSPMSEQHTLGIYVLGEFLRRAGWGVQVSPSMSEHDLIALVESEPVDMVGISVSNQALLESGSRLGVAVKRASLNPNVGVLLGGSPELAERAANVGAAYCSDPLEAVRWLDNHVKFTSSGPS